MADEAHFQRIGHLPLSSPFVSYSDDTPTQHILFKLDQVVHIQRTDVVIIILLKTKIQKSLSCLDKADNDYIVTEIQHTTSKLSNHCIYLYSTIWQQPLYLLYIVTCHTLPLSLFPPSCLCQLQNPSNMFAKSARRHLTPMNWLRTIPLPKVYVFSLCFLLPWSHDIIFVSTTLLPSFMLFPSQHPRYHLFLVCHQSSILTLMTRKLVLQRRLSNWPMVCHQYRNQVVMTTKERLLKRVYFLSSLHWPLSSLRSLRKRR
jgi:hypothetical protein